MKLLTKELLKRFKQVGSQEIIEDPVVICKFFTPWSNWTWYATEFDEETSTFFGYVEGLEDEFGYFTLEDLQRIEGPVGLRVERDLWFKEKVLSECLD